MTNVNNLNNWAISFENQVNSGTMKGVDLKTKTIIVDKILDDSSHKKVTLVTRKNIKYVLWKDAAYDAIGDWTNAQAETRLREMVAQNIYE